MSDRDGDWGKHWVGHIEQPTLQRKLHLFANIGRGFGDHTLRRFAFGSIGRASYTSYMFLWAGGFSGGASGRGPGLAFRRYLSSALGFDLASGGFFFFL